MGTSPEELFRQFQREMEQATVPYLRGRVERPHHADPAGRQILAPSPSTLTAAERQRLPNTLTERLESFASRVRRAPKAFRWMASVVEGAVPVLECSKFERRQYWRIRLARPLDDCLARECFGFDADPGGPIPTDVPPRLAWLRETFGTIDLVAEQSGTASFGRTFAEVVDSELAAHLANLRSELPDVADRWVSLYEINGDWIFADVENDETVWIGSEATGEDVVRFPVPYTRAASFVLWRLLEGGAVRPVDFEMLAAGMRRVRSR